MLQILTKVPLLEPVVIAKLELPVWKAKLPTWNLTTLRDVFSTILQQTEVQGDLCLFIDALDEYSGTDREIAEWINNLTSTSDIQGFRVKACVSSRPRTMFHEIFRNCPALIMHQWTIDDITHYVNHSLQQHSRLDGINSEINRDETNSLAKKIVDRASGVFLWVKLVVEDLYQGLCDGNSILELHSRLEELPVELNDMYTRILTRVDGRYLEETAFLFGLIQRASNPLTLLSLPKPRKKSQNVSKDRGGQYRGRPYSLNAR